MWIIFSVKLCFQLRLSMLQEALKYCVIYVVKYIGVKCIQKYVISEVKTMILIDCYLMINLRLASVTAIERDAISTKKAITKTVGA